MGKYLDRLNEQFDTITAGVDVILDRAADENRDVTDAEQQLVEREQTKADDLKKVIEHYQALEETRAKVADVRAKAPTVARSSSVTNAAGRSGVVVVERSAEDQLKSMFPTVGDYIVTVGRALRGDPDAGTVINRAQDLYKQTEVFRATDTQHQTTADNPGLIPRPILGPLVTLINSDRPFITAISRKPLPTGSFDRPVITQHVGVGKQAGEKQRTESRKLLIGKLPVTADTYAGHLNISRQDVKWSSPGIMQIIGEDFAHEYAMETEQDAELQFASSLTGATPVAVASWEPGPVRAALFAAALAPIKSGEFSARPDTLFMAPDVWGQFGGMVNAQTGLPTYPGLTPGDPTAGDIGGFKTVLGPWLPSGFAALGPARVLEWYEDIDGLLQVAEPDVLGQLVGYAGYGAFLNTAPQVFTLLGLPAITIKAGTPASAVSGVSAGSPGKFAPNNAGTPANLAALKADPVVGDTGSNKPTTKWTSGQSVKLGTGSAYWDGTAWVAGTAS